METKPETYTEHEGTVRISGGTIPRNAAHCAHSYLEKGIKEIEFFYIGANAGQQAMKAMTILGYMVREDNPNHSAAFEPIRVQTNTTDAAGVVVLKDATVWRTIIIEKT